MNFAVVASLFAMLAIANAGLLAAPVGYYATQPLAVSTSYNTGIIPSSSLYASPPITYGYAPASYYAAPVVYAPATNLVRVARGAGSSNAARDNGYYPNQEYTSSGDTARPSASYSSGYSSGSYALQGSAAGDV